MTKVNFNVRLNKKETKYLTPEGKEVERVSTYKKILGDPWSKYSIGIYKGRDMAYSFVKENRALLESEKDFKDFFNKENKKTKEKALERGSLYHEEIEEAFKEADYKKALQDLATRKIDGQDASNPFAKMVLEFMEQNPDYEFYASELSFTYEGWEGAFGGTVDLVFVKKEEINITGIKIIDFKTSKQSRLERHKHIDTYIEYALQQLAYSTAIFANFYDKVLSEIRPVYSSYIFWEDGEIIHLSEEILCSFETLFVNGISYQEELKEADKVIKNLLKESTDDEPLPQ